MGKKIKTAIAILLLIRATGLWADNPKQPVDYVNPFIGTADDHGQLYPGAVKPFGLVRLSPDTYPSATNGVSHAGYNYNDRKIIGFSHFRLGGVGCKGEGGNIRFIPTTGELSIIPAEYSAIYDKNSETASPGYYAVILDDYEVTAELTVTDHVGFHKYTFPESKTSHILIDVSSTFTKCYESYVEITGNNQVAGYVVAGSLCKSGYKYTLYFVAEFNKPFSSSGTWRGKTIHSEQSEESGTDIGAFVNYSLPQGGIILVKVGLSLISQEQARRNIDAELPDWDFDRVRREGRDDWNKLLRRIEVEGGTQELKEIFYTAFYHSNLIPMNTTDANGRYLGFDNVVHQAGNYTHYDTYSLWDTFRTKHPLLTLTQPEMMTNIVRSLTDIYQQGGWMPKWPVLNHYASIMLGDHATAVIVDAYLKGITDFDVDKAYEGMRKSAMEQPPGNLVCEPLPEGRVGIVDYKRLGYVPARPDRTLEFAYDDWCLAQLAKTLGKVTDYEYFIKRAANYKNTWDSSVKFMQGRSVDGTWLKFYDPREINEKYFEEGSAWQWTWFVPHDVQGLINLMGGREAFVEQLDTFFEENLYTHGNEPDLHTAYLYNYAGAPWKTQKQMRKILTEPVTSLYGTHGYFSAPIKERIYRAEPAGFLREQDDDCGTMSAWYVFSAMGFYPVCPGQNVYVIGSPIFNKITINLGKPYKGGTFVIKAENLSAENRYIQSATLNGKSLNKPWIKHSDLVEGGTLVFQMGPEPNEKWGSKPEDAPPSMTKK